MEKPTREELVRALCRAHDGRHEADKWSLDVERALYREFGISFGNRKELAEKARDYASVKGVA